MNSPRDDATVAPDATLDDGVTVPAGCRIARGVVIESGVTLGVNVVASAQARVACGVEIGAGAYVGSGTVIGEMSVIGPNAVVRDDIQIGTHAKLTAGSVATDDVPAYAVAEGNPARIIGYRSSPAFDADRRLRASSLGATSMPLPLGRATLHEFPRIDDLRGGLVFGEVNTHLPFTPVRYFTVFGVPTREVRGEHSHKQLHELLICVHGECTVMVNDGTERAEILLDRPDVALHLPPLTWTAQYQYSPDAVLLVLCSHVYEAEDYIRTYDEFEEVLRHNA